MLDPGKTATLAFVMICCITLLTCIVLSKQKPKDHCSLFAVSSSVATNVKRYVLIALLLLKASKSDCDLGQEGKMAECVHMLHLVPVWQSEERHRKRA